MGHDGNVVPITVGESSQCDSDEEFSRVRRQLYQQTDSSEDWSDPPVETTSPDTSLSLESEAGEMNVGLGGHYVDDYVTVREQDEALPSIAQLELELLIG